MSRVGPKLTVDASCRGCEHLGTFAGFICEATAPNRRLRLSLETDEWCPVMTDEQRAALGWESER